MQPTRSWPSPRLGRARVETSRFPSSTDEFAPAWPCSRRGLPGRVHYCTRRWSLTPPFHHHYPARKGGVAVCFCGPVPAGSRLSAAFPPRVLSDAVLYGVRTFLDPVNAEPRLPDQPEAASSYPPGAAESTWGTGFSAKGLGRSTLGRGKRLTETSGNWNKSLL